MNDKQKLALKELADVMEKHELLISNEFYGAKGLWVFSDETAFYMDRSDMNAKDIRAELSKED